MPTVQELAQGLIGDIRKELPQADLSSMAKQLLPIPDEFSDFGAEVQEAKEPTSITDTLQGIAKSMIGISPDTTVSLTKKPDEDLEFGEENIGFFPSSKEEAFEAVAPSLTLLSSPITMSTNAVLALAGNDQKKRLQSMARIAMLNPQEGDELFVGDMLKEFGINDTKIDEYLEPIGLGDFARTANLTEKIGLLGDFIGFSAFEGLLKKIFITGNKAEFSKEIATRIKEAKDAGKTISPKTINNIKGVLPVAAGGAALTGTLALLNGEVEAGVGDIARKVIQFPGKAAKKTIHAIDPLTKFPNKPINKRASGFRVKNLVKERLFNIDEAFLESTKFINEFERELSVLEREALPFIRQGMKNPEILKKIGREDLIPIVKNPSEKLLKANERLGKYYDDAHEMLSEVFDDVNFIENYVTQVWDIPKNRRSEVVNHFATHNPFTKKRKIPTLEAGIELGLKPKSLDIVKLLQAYDQYKIKTVFNNKFADALSTMIDAETGIRLVQRGDVAPFDWVTVDNPALNRAMFVGKTKDGGAIIKPVSVKVHPEIAAEVQAVFSTPIRLPVINTLETINAFTKKSMLSFSFFHHFALTESAFSSGIGKRAIKMWNPYKVYKALKNKDYEIFNQMPLARDSIQHGVKYGSLPDFMISRVKKGFESIENATKNIPIVGKTTKLARKANDLWDAALWDYYHNTLKLYAYENNVGAALKSARKKIKKKFKRDLTDVEINEIKDSIGSFVNDSFGGQQWELAPFFRDAKARQMMHWLLLSPDWTVSVLKQAFAPIKGHRQAVAAGSIERRLAGSRLSKRATLFWLKAAFYYNLIAQSANFYNTGKNEWKDGKQVATFRGKARFTDENAPGHKLDIFAGFNPDGTERYIRMGKQFREVMEWSYEPERKLGAKLSPVLRAGIAQITKADPGSGFPTSYSDMPFYESLPERTKSLFVSLLPFSFRGLVEEKSLQPFFFALPTSRGMTNAKTIRLFKQAIEEGDMAREIEIGLSALKNNLNSDVLYSRAMASLKGDGTREAKDVAAWAFKTIKKYPREAQPIVYQRLVNQGVITPQVQHRLELMKIDRESVKSQRRAVGLE